MDIEWAIACAVLQFNKPVHLELGQRFRRDPRLLILRELIVGLNPPLSGPALECSEVDGAVYRTITDADEPLRINAISKLLVDF